MPVYDEKYSGLTTDRHRYQNDVGRELLSFLSLHQDIECNTSFEKENKRGSTEEDVCLCCLC